MEEDLCRGKFLTDSEIKNSSFDQSRQNKILW